MRYIWLVLIGLLIIIANVAVVMVYRYERRPRKSDCVENLVFIVNKMAFKAAPAWKLDRSSSDFPKKLLELFKGDLNTIDKLKKKFVCPFCRERCETGEFTYSGPSIPERFRIRSDLDWPILWDRPENHPDGVHVAFYRNGQAEVEWFTYDEFDKLKAEVKKKIAKLLVPKNDGE